MRFLTNLLMIVIIAVAIFVLVFLPWPALIVLVVLLALWMAFTRTGRQAWSVTKVGVATIPQRLGSSSVIIVGIAGVVGVLVALLAMAEGFRQTLAQTGDADTAIVMRGGATAELNVVANIPKKVNATDANVEIRGVGEKAFALRPNVKIVSGKRFGQGLRELIVGKGALAQFAGLDPGSTINLGNQQWTITGVFESGDAHESELWGDVEVVSATYRRQGYQSVTVRLTSPDALDSLKAGIAADPRLKVDAKTTSDYYSAQSENLTRVIKVMGIIIGVIMGIGA